MGWILLLTIFSQGQSSMTSVVFSDYKSCMDAGYKLKEAANKHSPLFKHTINYECISVTGLK